MTTIQANAIVKAREEMKRARKELQRVQLQETRYRGIPTVQREERTPIHGTFTYRGIGYTK